MKKKYFALSVGIGLLWASANANATLVTLHTESFTPATTEISFSGFLYGTVNPVYTIETQTVNFGGYFSGGLGTPTVGPDLTLDPSSPQTIVTADSANPTSHVLSGTNLFKGPIGILFSENVAAVGLNGGYFDAIGGTSIAAYGRDGNILGSVTNSAQGIEFFGLGDDSGNAVIAGIQIYITGKEPGGYAIDGLTFAHEWDGYNPDGNNLSVPAVPEPTTMLLFGTGLAGLVAVGRRRRGDYWS